MSAPIGPGDWVECVDASGTDDWPWTLHEGRIYQVAEVADCGYGPVVQLVELGHAEDDDSYGFGIDRFRPIYRPKADLIESLKAPPKVAPVKEPEAA